MRLTLRQEWRPRALKSIFGLMDIKTGVTIAIMFALFNKVAGVYGLIAIFNGGSFAQLSMYIYSVLALAAFAWGLKAVTEEDPRRTLYFAHLFIGDHLLNTFWTVFFAVLWWVYDPHDGKRIANSEAQKSMMGNGGGMTDVERKQAAQLIWNKEKGLAATFLILGWLAKFYFAALLYSYAIHLRRGSYHHLPLPHSQPTKPSLTASSPTNAADEYELDENSERRFLQTIPRRPNGLSSHHNRSASQQILSDLEAPTQTVLWDEDEDVVEAATSSSSAAPFKGPRSETTPSDAESDRGDISANASKTKKQEAGKTRLDYSYIRT